MDLLLGRSTYLEFLAEFRRADRALGAGAQMIEVVYSEEQSTTRYYFTSPNFYLNAYDTGGGRVLLTSHVYPQNGLSSAAFTLSQLKKSLREAGNGATNMTENLCRVVAFTSEAARSKVVEAKMMLLFDSNGSAKLSDLQFLFNEYGKTAEHAGYWRNGAYMDYWKPLEKYDYRRYFVSDKGNKNYVAAVDAL
jgi:hypothetical protein